MQLELHGSTIVADAALDGAGGEQIRAATRDRRAALVSDSNVMPLHGEPLARRLGVAADDCFTVPAGEGSKSRSEWARLTDMMLARGFGRDTIIIAVGGGVVGDLAGFVAATYMRGVPFVQVPTTLLAMIDASIGGKTGIDTPAGKNLVGAFHHPALVVADPATLRTLPNREFRSGLAEALKHAVITSAEQLDWLVSESEGIAALDTGVIALLLRRNVQIKHAVVTRDERESGLRKTLNAGHTIGHAIESVSGFEMLHGECIAIGLVVEAIIAVGLRIAEQSLVDQVKNAAMKLNLPVALPAKLSVDELIAATKSDKKARAGVVEYALFSAVGHCAGENHGFGTPVADSVVRAALNMAVSR